MSKNVNRRCADACRRIKQILESIESSYGIRRMGSRLRYCDEEQEKKLGVILIAMKNSLPVIATRYHMIQTALDLDPWFPGHTTIILSQNRNIACLTLFSLLLDAIILLQEYA